MKSAPQISERTTAMAICRPKVRIWWPEGSEKRHRKRYEPAAIRSGEKAWFENESTASFTVSAVILGIALANLPFGRLADRYSVKPIILIAGCAIAVAGLLCTVTKSFWVLTGARFFQGLFIPGLTTCLAAYLAKNLPAQRLNVAMGAYVSATVVGGLGGRLKRR